MIDTILMDLRLTLSNAVELLKSVQASGPYYFMTNAVLMTLSHLREYDCRGLSDQEIIQSLQPTLLEYYPDDGSEYSAVARDAAHYFFVDILKYLRTLGFLGNQAQTVDELGYHDFYIREIRANGIVIITKRKPK